MNSPVALIIFNRPDLTAKVFSEIAKAKPEKLFVIADGPRDNHLDDVEKCNAARAIIDRVDWECKVFKNYSDINLGCGRRPATGISWVFEHVEEAIILEDDCVPHPTFFRFCEELLGKYRYDNRIMQINGQNFHFDRDWTSDSYLFSSFNICWGGWATWRRAWQYFDFEIKMWFQLRATSWLSEILKNEQAVEIWQKLFDRAYESAGEKDFWDYQWRFAFWGKKGLAIMPNVALISNIGFREDGTHTKSGSHALANLDCAEMSFPLKHSAIVERHRELDHYYVDRLVRTFQPRMANRRENPIKKMSSQLWSKCLVKIKKKIRWGSNAL